MSFRVTNQELRDAAQALERQGTGYPVDRTAMIAAIHPLLCLASMLRQEDPSTARDLHDAAIGMIFGETPETATARQRALRRAALIRTLAETAVFDVLIEEDD